MDAAVLHADDPLGVAGHAFFVRHQDDRLPLRMELIEQNAGQLAVAVGLALRSFDDL